MTSWLESLTFSILDAASNLPFTYINIVRRALEKNSCNVLDVGCGNGTAMKFLKRHSSFSSVGMDLCMPSLKNARRQSAHDDCIYGDARFLPIRSKSFDTVICLRLLEMLAKTDGLKLLKDIEKVARKQVIVSTTVGFIPPSENEKNSSPLELRKSGWTPSEFIERHYQVRGQGLGIVYGKGGLKHRLRENSRWPIFLSYLLEPAIYFFPSLAAHMICVKNNVL